MSRIVVKRHGNIRNKVIGKLKPKSDADVTEVSEISEDKPIKNNKKKGKKNMITEEQIASAEDKAMNLTNKKVLKSDRGLIERTESSKIILAEDNRQLLND